MIKKIRHLGRMLRAPFNRRDAIAKLNVFHEKSHSLEELVDFALSFESKGLYRVDLVQVREEIVALVKAVDAIKPLTILEIGTLNGGTLLLWSNIASKRAISCDLTVSKYRNELYTHFSPKNSGCEVLTLEGNSHDQSFRKTVSDTLNGELVDFLFIDGDHTEVGAEADFDDYRAFVKSGGIIAFHDIVKKQPTPQNQVYYLWERIKKKYKTEDFVKDYNQTGFGIGIIHVE